MTYLNRREAGRRIAEELRSHAAGSDLVLGLPRGGVPVAFEVAQALNLPLDVYPVRKLGMPGREELAIGAVASGAAPILNAALVSRARVSAREIDAAIAAQTLELRRQENLYRQGRPPAAVSGRSIVLVDDGLATGYTMRAAIAALRQSGAKRITAAVPVGPPESCDEIAAEADAVVCPLRPPEFMAVGEWYEDFAPTTDAEVAACLAQARRP